MMKFVLAPDSFKESMSAKKAALAMEKGIRKVFPDAFCEIVPMADGGEGTVESLVDATDGKIIKKEVTGPLGNKVAAEYGLLGDGQIAVIEMASASGLQLVSPGDRNPMTATTYGTGELIRDALDRGVKRILMGIGGSATNDGGAGMLQALGVSFKDQHGKELAWGGGALADLATIDMGGLDARLKQIHIDVACDVTNPLTGPSGASYIYGPQKGANPETAALLDQHLAHYAAVIKEVLGMDIVDVPGSGAAGGLGAGLLAFLHARLKKGVELVIEYTGLSGKISGADFVFTGEGSIDSQTLFGKTLFGVAKVARSHSVPVIAFAGRVGKDIEPLYEYGFSSIVGIMRGAASLEEALASGEENVMFAAENICRVIRSSLMKIPAPFTHDRS
jgi:glycerate 2-kinase